MIQYAHMYERTPQYYLETYFRLPEFRFPQKDIIDTVLAQKDALVLMPTGAGKSLCYQIPALMLPGITIVISPLISLMKDQVQALTEKKIGAAYINSSLDSDAQQEVINRLLRQEVKLLYVSPEKFVSADMLSLLERLKVSLVAIDEAHCVSTWGHDFRKEYTKIKTIRSIYQQTPFLALTATADATTKQDIVTQLALKQPVVFTTSFDRPNIYLRALPGQKRFESLLSFIQERPGKNGIVYTLSRKSTQFLAQKLREQGIRAGYYHAGLTAEERSAVQQAFMNGEIPVLCATIAFGMGIDKPDIRWVIHYNMPKNIEGYYQEIGRAGRDGQASDALLFYSKADIKMIEPMIEQTANSAIQKKKLSDMYAYASTKLCRRQLLLEYFDESAKDRCGSCDRCEESGAYIDGTIITQKICSAIARLGTDAHTATIIAILLGEYHPTLLTQGYTALQTFGCGKELSRSAWQYYIQELEQLGVIQPHKKDTAIVQLTNKGKEILCGERTISLSVFVQNAYESISQQYPSYTTQAPQEKNTQLFDTLLRLRKEIAEDEQRICVMMNDTMLAHMAKHMPVNEEHMQQVPGMTRALYDEYGALFVGTILAFHEEQQVH